MLHVGRVTINHTQDVSWCSWRHLSGNLKLTLELLEEHQALHCLGKRRLILHHVLQVPQASPGLVWRWETSHLPGFESPDLGDQGMDVRLETFLVLLGTHTPRFPVLKPRPKHSCQSRPRRSKPGRRIGTIHCHQPETQFVLDIRVRIRSR
jgi:hypothetical protein